MRYNQIIFKLFCSLPVLLFGACNGYSPHPNPVPENPGAEECAMVADGQIILFLDSVTSNNTISSQYLSNDHLFSFLANDQQINVYDLTTNRFCYKIPVCQSSLNHPVAYNIVSPDSIYVLDYSGIIGLIDRNGNLREKRSAVSRGKYYPMPITGISPLILRDGRWIFAGNMAGEYSDENGENRLTLCMVDTTSGQVSAYIPYPDVYRDQNWGGGLFRWVYMTYNPTSDRVIMSFPADHFIYEVDLQDFSTRSYYAGSKYIDKTESLNRSKRLPLGSEGKIRHFAETNSYSRILYDPYRNVYYRIAEQATRYDEMKGWKKPVSVIVMDSTFRIIGESLVEDSFSPGYRYTLFVDRNGLQFQQKSDEDHLIFQTYKFTSTK